MSAPSNTADVRSAFLSFFTGRGHEVVDSSPLVPRNDPTLLFTNAGMVQFKNVFTGLEERPYSKAVTSQKCLRAGGKHNDLENVGYTARHHTFFEMLGNFSFGAYFKEEAIEAAWTLITKEFGLAPERLLVTVYAEDDEAFGIWKRVAGLPENRILRIATSDNFWAMGDTGPCGPCSEIFYDHGEEVPGGPPGSADEDGDRFVEIWNLVFMQYEQTNDGKRTELPRPSIDTGMGLERMAAVMQGVTDNYETDLFRALIEASVAATKTPAEGEAAASHRVIADHLRACSFVIADGVLPANEGRGYVLRRIARRAMRHARFLGVREPILCELVAPVVAEMGMAFPELTRARSLIEETLRGEEERFREALERGMKLLSEETDRLGAGEALPGKVAFRLYDTYGFPVDLTEDILRGQGRTLERESYEKAMEHQRATARGAWSGSGEEKTDKIWFEIHEKTGSSEFLGYAGTRSEASVTAIVTDGKLVNSAKADAKTVGVVCNQTPFYAEGGGQIGDTGALVGPTGKIRIEDTRAMADGMHVHFGTVKEGEIHTGVAVVLEVDDKRRARLRAHHSATHLLHAALRKRLGEHVTQKGSFVAPDRLRFDISHPKAINPDEIHTIEQDVNDWIRANAEVSTRILSPDDAIAAGALGLFGEKYGDEVRVVSMDGIDGERFSMELCGGTHVARTGEIGLLKIVSESALAAGVRRIEAVAGAAALALFQERTRSIEEIAGVLGVPGEEAPVRVVRLLDERRKLEKEASELRRKIVHGGANQSGGSASRSISGVSVAGRVLEGVPPRELRPLAAELRRSLGSGIAIAVTDFEGKGSLAVGVSEDLLPRFDAVALVQIGVNALGGKKGGGRRDMAQGGGPDASATAAALAAIEQAIEKAT